MGKVHRNSLQPGHKLHWYEIKEILGQGGFGITYLAHDANLDEDVAIKEYLPIEMAVREGDFSVHPVSEGHEKTYQWGLERFISEARTLAKFKHPNIVRVRNVFEDNNTAYIVMEYEQGNSLQEKLSGRKTLEEPELLKILIPILGGLEQVHAAGFIHRDIKPDNIFIRKDGSPVLLDFGSARQAMGEHTKTLTSLVTPGYAPFEQYFSKSDEQGPWTDIYGVGATLYRAISGIAPINAVDRSKAIHKTSKDTLVSAMELGKGKYSESFLKAIDHGIQFNQDDRPQTIQEWKSEFGVKEDLAEKQAKEIIEKEAKAKQKAEEERLAALEKQKLEEEQKLLEEKRIRLEEEKRKLEEARLAELERKQQEEEAKVKARAETEQAKLLLSKSLVGLWKLTLRCWYSGDTYPLVLTILDANGEFSLKGEFGIYNFKEGRINNDSISYIYNYFSTSNEEYLMNFSGKLISKTRMEGTYTTTSNNDVCNWDLIR